MIKIRRTTIHLPLHIKKAVDYRVYVNNGENEKAEQVVKDIDNAQFNNVLFKEALENVKNIYISNGLSQ